jgi:uncharacterized protein (DUF1330 family)
MDNQNIPAKGYLIANFTIHDEGTFKYIEAGGSLAAKFNGRVISYDVKPRVVEGNAEAVMAIMEFNTLADAKRFYSSPEYTAARQFRIASTKGTIVLVEGL